jgi:hypothetical protein
LQAFTSIIGLFARLLPFGAFTGFLWNPATATSYMARDFAAQQQHQDKPLCHLAKKEGH